jgi:mRNA-degrading endonuclease YafQ of YafQ-DinJ toxin-antitoxin module
MYSMPVEFSKHFEKQFLRLSIGIQRKVIKACHLLDVDYRHPGLKTHLLGGHLGIFEASVDDKYRMTYERRGEVFYMRNVDNHDECLKNP